MASTRFYDERFYISLQALLEQPNKLDHVLKLRGDDGAKSCTYDAFSALLDLVMCFDTWISTDIPLWRNI